MTCVLLGRSASPYMALAALAEVLLSVLSLTCLHPCRRAQK
jgi:hypothetical protein